MSPKRTPIPMFVSVEPASPSSRLAPPPAGKKEHLRPGLLPSTRC